MKRPVVGVLLLMMCTSALFAQSFTLFNRKVQVHGFASQGFVYTDDNNWMTAKTSDGSFAFTDFGANASVQLTNKFRIGAQFYDRNMGNLGNWHPSLDWGVADYRFTRWLGVRGGKVKTTLGLYNDSQDVDALHTFAFLPQSIYPSDMRDSTIAHTGGDVYGDIDLEKHHLGTISYTGYAGNRQDSKYGGYPYMLSAVPIIFNSYGGLQYGGDLRWATPLKGLLIGASRMNEDITGKGTASFPGLLAGPYAEHSKEDWTNQFYAQYAVGKLQIDAEQRRYWRDQSILNGMFYVQTDVRGFYVSGTYRVAKKLQVGSYYSRFTVTALQSIAPPTDGHTYDKVATARYDVNRFMNVKVEGHFMDGAGLSGMYPSGFYAIDNPQGLKPNTKALVVKTGFNF